MSDRGRWPAGLGCATTTPALSLLAANYALASQGPGGGLGTAGATTQTLMAILAYGASAIVIAAGLIGILRQRHR
jgi:hypothetical protein